MRKNMKEIHIPRVAWVLAALGAALAVAGVLVTVLTGSSGQLVSHDSIELSTSPALENGLTVGDAFPGIGAGTQVTIVNSANDVIATTVLTEGASSIGTLLDGQFYNFTVTVPDGLPRYGIEVPGLTVMWASEAQMRDGVTINAEK